MNLSEDNNKWLIKPYQKIATSSPHTFTIYPAKGIFDKYGNKGNVFYTDDDTSEIIHGVVNEQPTFNFKAGWSQGGNLITGTLDTVLSVPIAGAVTSLANRSLTAAGAVTSKFYDGKGSDLSFSVSFTITDTDGEGFIPMHIYKLMKYVLPKSNYDIGIENSKKLFGDIETALTNLKSNITEGDIYKTIDPVLPNLPKVKVDTKTKSGSELKNIAGELTAAAQSTIRYTSNPDPVAVRIGDWFYCDNMVIVDVSFSLSHELVEVDAPDGTVYTSPFSATIMVQLETQQNLVLDVDESGDTIGLSNLFFGSKAVQKMAKTKSNKKVNI